MRLARPCGTRPRRDYRITGCRAGITRQRQPTRPRTRRQRADIGRVARQVEVGGAIEIDHALHPAAVVGKIRVAVIACIPRAQHSGKIGPRRIPQRPDPVRIDLVIGGMVIIGLIGLSLDGLMRLLEGLRTVRWRYAR